MTDKELFKYDQYKEMREKGLRPEGEGRYCCLFCTRYDLSVPNCSFYGFAIPEPTEYVCANWRGVK